MRGEKGGVDPSGGNAGDDGNPQVGEPSGQAPEESHLVGGSRSAAAHYKAQVGAALGSGVGLGVR